MHKAVSLVVVGPEWDEDELRVVERLGIEANVVGLQRVSDSVLVDLYQSASALVYPSLYEGFGLPLLEAMAAGCPIVASRIPSTVEVAGDYPIYFDPTSTEDLLVALSSALDRGRSVKMNRIGAEAVSRHSWDRTAQLTIECYRDVSR
jgi:glycosyltransferase involved in cell wall biosynthesis